MGRGGEGYTEKYVHSEGKQMGTRKKEEERRTREKDGRLTLSMRSRHSALSTHSMSAQSIPSLLAGWKHHYSVPSLPYYRSSIDE